VGPRTPDGGWRGDLLPYSSLGLPPSATALSGARSDSEGALHPRTSLHAVLPPIPRSHPPAGPAEWRPDLHPGTRPAPTIALEKGVRALTSEMRRSSAWILLSAPASVTGGGHLRDRSNWRETRSKRLNQSFNLVRESSTRAAEFFNCIDKRQCTNK
jgi:hypothetical protein